MKCIDVPADSEQNFVQNGIIIGRLCVINMKLQQVIVSSAYGCVCIMNFHTGKIYFEKNYFQAKLVFVNPK